jgi:protein ImuB
MRRVVSVWFPTPPTAHPGQREGRQGRGFAPNPTKGRRPLEPLIEGYVREGAIGTVDGSVSPPPSHTPERDQRGHAPVVRMHASHDAGPGQSPGLLPDLAASCLRYAPLVGLDPPDGLWIDVTGSAHLHGGETRLLHDLLGRLPGARAAVADTPAVAHAVARFGNGGVVPPGAAVMDGFPIEALRLPADVLAELRLLGFERVGKLATAARAPLVRRFGALLASRLDQAAGAVFEPIVPVVPQALVQARLGFVEPLLTAEAFSAVIVRLLDTVCGDLERAGLGARRLDLLFERVDGSVQAIRVGTARPGRDARHLGRMLDERLERVDPGLGVEAMRLVVAAADPVGFVQTVSSLAGNADPDIAPLVDRLANRLGEAQVYRMTPVESDVPERSVRRVPALSLGTGGPVAGARVTKPRIVVPRAAAPRVAPSPVVPPPVVPPPVVPPGAVAPRVTRSSGASLPVASWPADLPRPVRLLDPPQPIEAMALLPDHPPVAFTWRRVRHLVRHADGPERIAGEWWKRDREWYSVRDYFRVEDETGRRFWLFRRGNGSDADTGDMHWFLHGVF